jgi:hypothetical protein
MSDRELLMRIHEKVDAMAEDVAAHLAEHRALAGVGGRRIQWLAVAASWVGAAVAIAALLSR